MCRGMMMIGFMIKRFRPIWFQGILDQEATSFNFDSRRPIKQSLCSYRAVLKTILGAWIVVSLLFSLRAKWVFDFLHKQSRMHSIATIRPNNNNNNNKFTLSEWTLTMAYLWKSSVTGHLAIFEIWDKEIMNFHLSFKNLLYGLIAVWWNEMANPKRYVAGMLTQARSQAGAGVRPATHLPKSKVYFYQQLEWAKNCVFVDGLKGVRFKNSTFWVQKVHFYTAPPWNQSWLRACASV